MASSWKTVDDYTGSPAYGAAANGPVRDIEGVLYMSGYTYDGIGGRRWIIRKSIDQGNTWTTFKDYQGISAQRFEGFDLLRDSSGNFFAIGIGDANDGIYNEQWMVRKSSDGGVSWNTVDTYQMAAEYNSQAYSATRDGFGNWMIWRRLLSLW